MERMRVLVDLLNDYGRAYYQEDAPLVSDAEYDALYDELLALERESGEVLEDSPSRRVGAAPVAKFEQHTHIARLYSLDKVQSEEELLAALERMQRNLDGVPCEFALEYKFDGLTINLTYDGGRLVQAATRGNGTVGEAILPQVMTIHSIPLTIPFKGRMEVQGEGYMPLSVLRDLNESGTEHLKNARNAAAGALRNLDPQVTARRKLACACYNIGYIEGAELNSHREMLEFLRENGLPMSPYIEYFTDPAALVEAIRAIDRSELDLLIDGMVIKLCDFDGRERLGYTDRFPRWAVAYKFPAEEVTSTIKEIIWSVRRTGRVTPLAVFEPVTICGATIQRATLNNYDDILRKRVDVGARVFIRRSNDVIPEILGRVTDEPSHVEMPTICPECGAHLERRGAHLFCPNSLSCRPQIVSRLGHFASRNAMDIENLSDKTVGLLIEKLGLSSVSELYELTFKQLIELPQFRQKRAEGLINAIEASKTRPLSAFLTAINIPNVGTKTAKDLAKAFGTLDALRKATAEELIALPDVGEATAQSIVSFFSDPSISAEIDKLISLGVVPPAEQVVSVSNALEGLTVVITGKLTTLTRTQAEDLVASHGGHAASSVSKKTDLVLAGENAGSKLDKAQSLGIRVVSESELMAMLEV